MKAKYIKNYKDSKKMIINQNIAFQNKYRIKSYKNKIR